MLVRRRQWGADERAVARRARRLFGSPQPYQWWQTRGLEVRPVREGSNDGVCGEWLAAKDAAAEVVLYIHGGGYVSCSAVTHRPITAALARLTGRRIFSLNYRLAPEHRYPAALDDALAAYRWLLAQEGIASASAVSVVGDSAGGGLVLGMLLRARDEGLPLPASAVCFSPLTDLAGTGETQHSNDGRCAMFRAENLREFALAYLGRESAHNPYASPVYADFRGLPPILLQVGSTELLLDDARRVQHKIQKAGGASRLEIYEDVAHCWQMLDGLVPEARQALRQAATFIREHSTLSA